MCITVAHLQLNIRVKSTLTKLCFSLFLHKYGAPHPQFTAHGSRPMPPLPDIWNQAQSQQQPRGPHTHSGQLKRPGPPLGEHSVIQHTPAPSLHRPMEDCPGPSKRKKSSGSEQVGNVFMASPMHFLS